MTKLVLDTSVVRNVIAGAEVAPLVAWRREGGTLHLADGTIVELLAHLGRDASNWSRWLSKRDAIAELLDKHMPLMMGGREVLAAAGLSVVEAPPRFDPNEQLAINQDVWVALTTKARLEDAALLIRPVYVDGADQALFLDMRGASDQLTREKREWTDAFGGYQAAAAAEEFNIPGRHVPPALIDDQVKKLGAFIDSRCSSTPLASVRLDAMMRVHVLLSLRALQSGEPYNAAKNANDVIDLDLHRYLALPAAVCTDDGGVHADLKAAGAWQREWVVRVADLATPERRARLMALSWSEDAGRTNQLGDAPVS